MPSNVVFSVEAADRGGVDEPPEFDESAMNAIDIPPLLPCGSAVARCPTTTSRSDSPDREFNPAVLGRSVSHYTGAEREGSPVPCKEARPAVTAQDMSAKIFTAGEYAFHKVRIVGDTGGTEMQQAAPHLQAAVELRKKYTGATWPILPSFAPGTHACDAAADPADVRAASKLTEKSSCWMDHTGVVRWHEEASRTPGYEEFVADLEQVGMIVEDGPSRSSCKGRLRLMETNGRMHSILNDDLEDFAAAASGREGGGGALGSCVRVDTRSRLSTAVQAKALVGHARTKLALSDLLQQRIPVRELSGAIVVPCTCPPGGECHPPATAKVSAMLRRAGIAADQLTVERLALQYSARLESPEAILFPCESATRPRGIGGHVLPLMLTSSPGGTRWAEAVESQLREHKGQPGGSAAEYGLYVNGSSRDEVPALAEYLQAHDIIGDENTAVRFFLELRPPPPESPVVHFGKWLENIFLPLMEASMPGTSPRDPVALLLRHIGGITVSSGNTRGLAAHFCPAPPSPPASWRVESRPPFNWLLFHVWANVQSLSRLRRARGLRGLEIRPRCGDNAEDFRSLCPAFLLGDSISGGVQLTHSAVLQYLYFLCQVPIHMCPGSASFLGQVTSFAEHPFPLLLRRGLRVTLGTDDPLLQQCGATPLDEEYRTAIRLWRLTAAEVGETARTSVVFSSFSTATKARWLGHTHNLGFRGNKSSLSSVPTIRLVFRDSIYQQEVRVVARCCINLAQEVIQSPKAAPAAGNIWSMIVTPRTDTSTPTQEANLTAAAPAPRRQSLTVPTPSRSAMPQETGGGFLGADLSQHVPLSRRASHLGSLTMMGRGGSGWRGDAPTPAAKARPEVDPVREAEAFVARYSQYAVAEEAEPYVEYHRIEISGPPSKRYSTSAENVVKALQLRQRYKWIPLRQPWEAPLSKPVWAGDASTVKFSQGMPTLTEWQPPRTLPTLTEYCDDLHWLHDLTTDPQLWAYAERRLGLLEHRFALHTALNALNENHARDDDTMLRDDCTELLEEDDYGVGAAQKDFYRAYKVDTHVHMAAGMTARMLLDFMKGKYENHGDDIVKLDPAGRVVTLKSMLNEMDVDMLSLSVNMLNVQADATLFERFDNFNSKYNPLGKGELREVFLKTDNYMNGRYFAELIRHTFDQYAALDPRSFSEMRLSIYGRKRTEWGALARWSSTFGMIHRQNKWMIQVPRIYQVWRKIGAVKSFGEMLANIFEPLWAVSMDPASDPALAFFLDHVSGFDSVDNEATVDPPLSPKPPDEWTEAINPSYSYYMYYMWANLCLLNDFRAHHGMSTFTLRPHAGEAGELTHLSACFLTASGIAHGINLAKNPVLEYLYYLARIPLYVSPLSNNSLFLEYVSNPFPRFFRRGLFVSLSTDDPLQFHHTAEPLVEEYSVASKVWRLSTSDLCEIARNSVLQSGFGHELKKKWIGELYFFDSSRGNLADLTHVDDIRITYRYETYHDEIKHIAAVSGGMAPPSAMLTLDEEDAIISHGSFGDRSRKRSMNRTGTDCAARRSMVLERRTTKRGSGADGQGGRASEAKNDAVEALTAENRKLRAKLQELELHLEVLQTLNPTSPFSDEAARTSMRKRRNSSLRAAGGFGSGARSGVSVSGGATEAAQNGRMNAVPFGTHTLSGLSVAGDDASAQRPPVAPATLPKLPASVIPIVQEDEEDVDIVVVAGRSGDLEDHRPRPLSQMSPASAASAQVTSTATEDTDRTAVLAPGGVRHQR